MTAYHQLTGIGCFSPQFRRKTEIKITRSISNLLAFEQQRLLSKIGLERDAIK